jgi:hypothetical protein
MSDAESEDVEEQSDEEQPEIADEEMADLDEIAEEVEAETAPDTEDAEDDNETSDDEDSGDSLEEFDRPDSSWGDMYVGTLTTVSNAIIEEHGKSGAEEVDEDLARQLHLDEYFDEWMQERGKAEMDPAQGVMFGTTMFLVAVIGTKTDLPAQLLEEADF